MEFLNINNKLNQLFFDYDGNNCEQYVLAHSNYVDARNCYYDFIHINHDNWTATTTAMRYHYEKQLTYWKLRVLQHQYFMGKIRNLFVFMFNTSKTPIAASNIVMASKMYKNYRNWCLTLLNRYEKIWNELMAVNNEYLKRKNKALSGKVDMCRLSYMPLEETVIGDMDLSYYILDHDYTYQYNKRKVYDRSNILPYYQNYIQEIKIPPTRNIFLLTKIKMILKAFRLHRLVGFSRIIFSNIKKSVISTYTELMNDIFNHEEQESIEFQMDTGQKDEPSIVKSENVQLVETSSNSEAVASIPDQIVEWSDYTSSDVKTDCSTMTDRWLNVMKFKWTSNLGRDKNVIMEVKDGTIDKKLAYIELPKFVILNDKYDRCEMPNCLPFNVHRYWRGDMDIKIQINSNKFQAGQLISTFYYEPDGDTSFSKRENVWTMTQNDHVILNAGSSNEATLHIPFKYHQHMLSTKKRSDIRNPLVMGRLYIRVLNPLNISRTGPKECYGAIFVKFSNNVFTGQISSNIDKVEPSYPQMFKIADKLITHVVDNMDNPTNSNAPSYFVPTASHSWCEADNVVERLHSLRLCANSQTPTTSKDKSDHTIYDLCSKFGLCTTLTWNQNQSADTNLALFEASPMMAVSNYHSILDSTGNLTSYCIPPVGIISSMFMYWRGSLEFKFDIIASQFHTGRLLIGYVPGATLSTPVTIHSILAGPHAVFSLSENSQFTYVVPYISDRVFWNRSYTGNYMPDDITAPSTLYIYILNPLIPMDSVSKNVEINVYMRGGPDFEVAVPVQPALGLSYNTAYYLPNKDLVRTLDGYDYYPGYEKDFMDGNRLIMRNGTGTDQSAPFDTKYMKDMTKLKVQSAYYVTSCYYKYQDSENVPAYMGNLPSLIPVKFGVLVWSQDGTTGKAVMCVVKDESDAKKAALNYVFGDKKKSACQDLIVTADAGTTGNKYSVGDPGWERVIVREYMSKAYTDNDFEVVAYPQGEETTTSNVLQVPTPLQSTGCGKMLFGEDFSSLKTLSRRYQHYVSISYPSNLLNNSHTCTFILPILPQGLTLDIGSKTSINEFQNRCRDGHIPIILSPYRYYRGSMRLKFVFSKDPNVNVIIQHRPDRKLRTLKPILCDSVDTAEGVLNHSYAFYVQQTAVNGIVEIEVPFYNNCAYNYLQRVNTTETIDKAYYELLYSSMGELTVILSKPAAISNQTLECEVYYSLGDDFQPILYQGFPPVVMLDDIAQPQMFKKFTDTLFKPVEERIKGEVAGKAQEVKDVLDQFKTKLLEQNVLDLMDYSITRSLLTNLSHIAVNPNLRSVGVGVVSFLIELGIVTTQGMANALGVMSDLLKNIKKRIVISDINESDKQQTISDGIEIATEVTETASPQGPEDYGCWVGLITLLWCGMCSLFSIANKKPDMSWGRFLVTDMRGVLSTTGILFILLRNISTVLEKMKIKIFGYLNPSVGNLDSLLDKEVEIKAWAEDVILLENPNTFEKNKFKNAYRARVNACYIRGSTLYRKIVTVEDKVAAATITKLYEKIKKVKENLLEYGDDALVRKEPFVIWQVGSPGIGKSMLTSELALSLLKHRSVKFDVAPLYYHEPSSQYWDSCQNNPVMVVDDMFAVQVGEHFERQLALLFSVVSPVILTPPKAAILDKGKPYNPEIFMINSNYDFVRFDGVNHDAIHRRRHMLVRAQTVNDPLKKKEGCPHCEHNLSIAMCPPQYLADYHHLEFYIANEVTNPNTEYTGPYDYFKYLEIVKATYDQVMNKNEAIYTTKVQNTLKSLSPDMDGLETTYEELLEHHINNQRFLHDNLYKESILGSFKRNFEISNEYVKKQVTSIQEKISQMLYSYKQKKNVVRFEKEKEEISVNDTPMSVLEQDIWKQSEELDFGDPQMNLNPVESIKMPFVDSETTYVQFRRLTKLQVDSTLSSKQILHMVNDYIANVEKYNKPERTFFYYNSFGRVAFGCAYELFLNLGNCVDYVYAWNESIYEEMCIYYTRMLNLEIPFTLYSSSGYFMLSSFLSNELFEKLGVHNVDKGVIDKYFGTFFTLMDTLTHGFRIKHDYDNISYLEYGPYCYHYLKQRGTMYNKTMNISCILDTYLDESIKIPFCRSLLTADLFAGFSIFMHLVSCNPAATKLARSASDLFKLMSGNRIQTSCSHFNIDVSTIKYDDDSKCFVAISSKDKKKTVNFTNNCDYIFCPQRSDFYKLGMYDIAIENNPQLIQVMRTTHIKDTDPIELANINALADIPTVIHNLKKKRQSLYDMIVPKLKKGAKLILDILKISIAVLMALSPLILAILMPIALYKSVKRCASTNDVEWSNYTESQSHGYKQQTHKTTGNTIPTYEMQSDVPQVDIALDRIKQNIFCIHMKYGTRNMDGYGLVINQRRVLLIRHYFEEFASVKESKTYFGYFPHRYNSPKIQFDLDKCEKKVINVRDDQGVYKSNIVVIELPLKFPESKSLTQFIALPEDHRSFKGNAILFNNNGHIHMGINATRNSSRPILINQTETTSSVRLQQFYQYPLQKQGMCGSILLDADGQRPIIGIHVAGVTRGNIRGISEPLDGNLFGKIKTNNVIKQVVIPDLDEAEFSKLSFESQISIMGTLPFTIHQSGNTNYVPSLVHGTLDVDTEPAPLSPKDHRLPKNCSPLEKGVEHMGRPPTDFNIDDIKEARFDLQQTILQNVKPVRGKVGVLPLEQAIMGDPTIKGFESLEWSTSAGYPLRFSKSKPASSSGKRWLFEFENVNGLVRLKSIHPELKKLLIFEDQCRKKKIKPFTLFIDSLKDHVIKTEKCSIPGKTRIFSISPVQFTIAFKQYFLDFLASYQNARFEAEHAIGIDVNSTEWTQLAGILQEKGPKIVCGDYKNFGPGLMSLVAQEAFEIIFEWYKMHGDEENNYIRRIMMSEIVGAYHAVSNVVYRAPSGIPSGSPITTPLNCLCNSIYLRIAWKYTTNLDYMTMNKYTNIITYGDDVAINVCDNMIEKFNTRTIGEFFLQYQIIFTDISKQGHLLEYRNLLRAEFLKNRFIPHPTRAGNWLAGLDQDSVNSCANWIHKKNNIREATEINCTQACLLAHGWGEDYYLHIAYLLQQACAAQNLKFRYPSWAELDRYRYSELSKSKVLDWYSITRTDVTVKIDNE